MKLFSRRLLPGALALFLFTTACNLPAGTPPPAGTIFPTGQAMNTGLPNNPAANQTPTNFIPVTGTDVVAQQCQFCVNDEVHAVLIMPASASFLVSEPVIGVNCVTAQVVNGRRILLCRGGQQTPFKLNVCVDASNCFQYALTLEPCPLQPPTGDAVAATPVILVPVNPGSTAQTVPTMAVPPPTQTVPSTSPVAPTAAPSLQPTVLPTVQSTALPPLLPTRVGRVPSAVPPPNTNLQDPEAFIRWYFGAVWQIRNYQDLWDNYLTTAFKSRTSSGGYDEYVIWWNSVERVDVNSVNVIQNDGTRAWVRVSVTFTMKDGRVISNQEYDYALLHDATRQTWMFDYLP